MIARLAVALAAFIALAGPAPAHDFKVGQIDINHPCSRPTPPSAPVAGGYMKLANTGSETDRLIEVTSPVAERAEIHRSVVDNGVASMRPVADLAVEPGATVDFKAEKLHIMFIKPNRQLKDGEKFPATLAFEKAGSVDVEFMVQMRASNRVICPVTIARPITIMIPPATICSMRPARRIRGRLRISVCVKTAASRNGIPSPSEYSESSTMPSVAVADTAHRQDRAEDRPDARRPAESEGKAEQVGAQRPAPRQAAMIANVAFQKRQLHQS